MARKPHTQSNGRSNNYFEKQKQRFGPNFLESTNARNYQIEAPMLFRDIAKGNIDTQFYNNYFSDPVFLDALIAVSYNNFTFHTISHRSIMETMANLNYSGAVYDYKSYQAASEKHRLSSEAYNILYSHLAMFKQQNCNPSVLIPMVAKLRNYKYDI